MTLDQIVLNFGNGNSTPFAFRKDSLSDKNVIQQIFVNRDYDIARLKRYRDIAAEYERILSAMRTPLIVDCGANIGASPSWFALSYPKARIFALEPDPNNFEILSLNCRRYTNITAQRAAISCKDETMFIEDPGEGDWGFRVTTRPAEENKPVFALSVDSIVKRFPDTDLFLVKIDIEGGEAHLFERNLDWIQRTMLIIIEFHDWLLPGSANSQNCLKALSHYNRDFVIFGENIFSIRNR